MKKKIIIISVTAVLVLAAAFCLWKFVFSGESSVSGSNEDPAMVASVANITGIGTGISAQTRFSGVVEPQKTLEIKKDVDKKVSSLHVSEGDMVKVGDDLFTYDTDDITLKLEQTKLEVETIAMKIQTLNNQITDLKKERSDAPESEQLTYTLQIQSLELDIKTEEYNKTTKANEVTKIENSLLNTSVKSEIDGIVKSVNSSGQSANGEELPYISILSTGNYRVKCTISELNINAISQGQPVIVRSRTDSEKTWNGMIETIDRENPVSNQNNGGMVYYSGGGNSDSAQSASKYYFFVTLDDYSDLILGQHVFTELDFGQTETKEGIWLPSSYIVSENGKSYVWMRGDNEKLEKRQITLGETDAELDTYEIKEGLKISDFIAFPQETLKNGMSTMVGDTIMAPEGNSPEGGMEEGDIGGDTLEGNTEGEIISRDSIGGAIPEGETEGNIEGEIIGGDDIGGAIPEDKTKGAVPEVLPEDEAAEKRAARAEAAVPDAPIPKDKAAIAAGTVV